MYLQHNRQVLNIDLTTNIKHHATAKNFPCGKLSPLTDYHDHRLFAGTTVRNEADRLHESLANAEK